MTLRSMSACLVSGVMLLGAGSATAQEPSQRAAERLAQFEQTGESRTCLSMSRISSIRPLDDSYFLVEVRGSGTWLTTMRGRCNQAASPFTYIQYSVPASQLCRGDIVQVVDSSTQMFAGSCSFGDFERLIPLDIGDRAASR